MTKPRICPYCGCDQACHNPSANKAQSDPSRINSPWLKTSEAADYLRCSPRKIEDLTSRGLLPFSRQDSTSPKSPRLYNRRCLDGYLISGKNLHSQRLSPEEKRLVKQLAL